MNLSPLQIAHLERAADVLRVVAHPVRLQIIHFLEDGEKTVTEIHQALGIAQAYTSQQLNLMKSRGILASRREGNQVYYRIENRNVLKIIHCVCEEESRMSDSS